MFVSTEKEQILLPLENGGKTLKSTSPLESDPDSINRFLAGTGLSDLVPVPVPVAIYTDVSVVPEQEKQRLEQTISTLEGTILPIFWH